MDQCLQGRPPAGSNFVDQPLHLTEVVLLGNIAIRTKEKLYWDGENRRFQINSEAANRLMTLIGRGWSL